jgi:hypothetical protein
MDDPFPDINPRRCAVCDEAASYGFGPPGSPEVDADKWYCGAHQREGERLWTARYRSSGGEPRHGSSLV